MKKLLLIPFILLVLSCKKESDESFGKTVAIANTTEAKTPSDIGKEIFNGKGSCATCHKVDAKLIGPSLKKIAKIYIEKKGNIVDFLKNDAKPIVDPTQYEIMKTNFALTKAMSDDELKALESYIYSVK